VLSKVVVGGAGSLLKKKVEVNVKAVGFCW
jgi:hypothetical protein